MTNNLGKTGKTLAALLAIAALFALSFPISSCKNFMKSDDDVKEQMQQEVDVANAPEVSVRVQPSKAGLGSVTPNGQSTFKVKVPSTILASESLEGGFIKWAAFYSGDLTTEVPGAVSFANPKAMETKATVLVRRSDIVIQAMFENLPKLDTEFPARYSNTSMQDSMVRITFSKPIDPSSFDFGGDSDGDGYSTKENGLFKNISLTMTIGGDIQSLAQKYYLAPTLSADKKTVTIKHINSVRKDDQVLLPAGRLITVTLSKDITDTSGLKMAADAVYSYTVGTGTDTNPPELGVLAGGTVQGTYNFTEASSVESRRTGAQNFYLLLKGEDVGGSVDYADITPTVAVYSSAGNVSSSQKDPITVPWMNDNGTPATISDYGADGLISLLVKIFDINGYPSTEKTYQYVRDTTSPPVDATQLARIKLSGTVSSGFYNKNSTITFSEMNPATDPILDAGYAGGGSVPRLNSPHANLKYRFGFNKTVFDSWTAWTAVTSSASLPISSYGSAESASVPVYVQLMDDLGNTSPVTPKTSIAIDNTPPTGAVSFTLAEAGGKKITSGTSLVPFTITASDGMSGVAQYYATETNLATAPAKGDAGWKTYTPSAGVVSDTITFTAGGQGTGDGKKTVYVWLMDNADNITTTALKADAYKDGTPPTVSDFFLRADAAVAVNGSGIPQNPNAQYAKTTTFYFAFIADDDAGGIGLKNFNYTDNGGSSSIDFAIATNNDTQGASPLQVSSIAVSQIGTTSAYRVFGKLTVSTTEDVHSITVRVKDLVGNTSAGLTNVGDNKCVYDTTVPEVSSVSLKDHLNDNCYKQNPFSWFTKDDTNTLFVTANDRANLNLGAVSGLKNATLAAVTASNYSALPTLTFPGLEGVTTSGTASAPIPFSAGAVDGPKAIVVTPYDYAGNSNPVTVYIYRDTAAPQVTLYLMNASTSYYFSKAAGGQCAYPSSAIAPQFKGLATVSLTATGIDLPLSMYSGIYEITYQLYKQTRDSSGVLQTPVAQAGYSGTLNGSYKPITVPVGSASANWIFGVKAMDNVGNVGVEEQIGYTYDINAPEVVTSDTGNEVRVTVYEAGDPNTANVAKYMSVILPGVADPAYCYVLPIQAFEEVGANATAGVNYASQPIYAYIKATDRPASDVSGSGIASITNNWGYYPLTGTPYTAARLNNASESSESDIAKRYVLLSCTSTQPYWSMSSYSSLNFIPTVIDAVGNQDTAAAIRIAVDNGIPNASLSYATYTGQDASVQYINGSSTFAFTPNDPVETIYTYSHVTSGIKSYQLSASATRPSATDPAWKSCSGGISKDASADFQSLVTASPAHAYLYVLDNAGNRGRFDLGNLEKDAVKPTYAITDVVDSNGKSAYKNGNFYFINTNGYQPTIECHDLVGGVGSGLSTCGMIDFGYDGSSFEAQSMVSQSVTEGDNSIIANSVSPSDPYWYVYPQYRYMTLGFELKDNAQNTTKNVASSSDTDLLASDLNVVYDNAVPKIASYSSDVTFTNVSTGTQRNVSDASTCVITPTDPNGTVGQPASGVKAWMLKRGNTDIPAETDVGWNTATTATIDISTEFKALVNATPGSIYLFLIDNVGNRSTAIDLGNGNQFVKDDSFPIVSISSMAQTYPGGSGGSSYFVNGSAAITFTASDIGSSGISHYLVSTSASETASTVNDGTEFGGNGTLSGVTIPGLNVSGKFNTSTAQTVYLYVTDKAGNLTRHSIVTDDNTQAGTAVTAKIDSTGPVFTTPDSGNKVVLAPNSSKSITASDGKTSISTDSQSVKAFFTGESSASGIKKVAFSGSLGTQTTPTLAYATGSATTDISGTTYSYDNATRTFTFNTPYMQTYPLVVKNVILDLSGASVSVTVTLTDAAGNASSQASQTITVDTTAPVINTLTLADAGGSLSAGFTNDSLVTATATYAETGSGVTLLTFAGDFDSFGTGVSVTYNGTTYTDVSGSPLVLDAVAKTITLPVAMKSGTDDTIEIANVQLNPAVATPKLTVTMTDVASQPSNNKDSDTLTRDTTLPAISVTAGSGTYSAAGATLSVTSVSASDASRTYYAKSSPASFTLSASDANIYDYWIDTTQTTTASNVTDAVKTLSAGSRTIYARDKAGNYSKNLLVTVTVDSNIPTFTFTPKSPCTSTATTSVTTADVALGTLYTTGTSLTVTLDIADTGGSGVKGYFTTAAGEIAHAAGSFDITLPATGVAQTIRVTDNVTNASKELTVTVVQDSSAPTLSMAAPNLTTVYPRGGTVASGSVVYTQNANVEIRATAVEDLTAVSSVNAVNNTTSAVTTGVFGSGTWALDLAPGYTYTVHAKNSLNLDQTQTVTITKDSDKPTLSFGAVSGTSPDRVVAVNVSDSGSGGATMTATTGTPDYTAGYSSGTLSGLTGGAEYNVTVTDRVGNSTTTRFWIELTYTSVAMFGTVPSTWTITGSGPYVVTASKIRCKNWEVMSGSTSMGTGGQVTETSLALPSLAAGTYDLILSDWETPVQSITISFTIGSGTVASPLVMGSSVIGERLSSQTVSATLRKERFETARSSSSTNLPVWYSEVGSIASSAKTERTGTASVTASKGVVQNLATPALADKKLSVEALHAAALSGMKATNGLTPRVSKDIAKTVRANETENFGDAIVMSAPEGSPAFVAYARGLAALRDVQNGSVAAKVDRASFTISDGEKPVSVWEKLLTFFGIEKKKQGQGFAMN